MGVKWSKTKFSEISKSHYLFSNYNYFLLRKEIDRDKSFLVERIAEYFYIISGFAFSSKDYQDEGVLVCRIGDISKTGEINLSDMKKLPIEYTEKYKSFLIKNGDILIGMTGDGKYFKTGFVENLTQNILLNQRVGILRLKETKKDVFNPKFLSLLLRTNKVQNQIRIVAMGKTQKNVSPFDILNVKFPRISYKKQNEIVDKITPIEQEIKQLKESKKDVLEIINEVFADYYNYSRELWKEFGKGMTAGTQKSYPKTFKTYKMPFSQIEKSKTLRVSSRFHNPITQKLTDILLARPVINIKKIMFEKVHRGTTPKYDLYGTIPVVKTGHLKNEYIIISDEEFVSEDFYIKKNNAQININDVLVASTGKVSLGKIDIVNTDIKLIADGHISMIRVDENKYSPLFLTYFLRSIMGAFQIERDYTGATNQIELYANEIENFDIPDISLNEQNKIVEKIKSRIDAQKEIDNQIEEKQNEISELIEKAIKENANA